MNLFPFGAAGNKEIPIKKGESDNPGRQRYELKLAEYKNILEKYQQAMMDYRRKLESMGRVPADGQLSLVQTALDLTQIKDQGKKTLEYLEELKQSSDFKILAQGKNVLDQVESLAAALIETNYQLEGLDKNTVNRLSDILMELHRQLINQINQAQTGILTDMEDLKKSVKGNRGLLWLLFIFQFLCMGGLAFIILYLLEIISF